MPLVYNEVAPAVDWLIGTERRTRADWKVLPRTDDDVSGADVKTKSDAFGMQSLVYDSRIVKGGRRFKRERRGSPMAV